MFVEAGVTPESGLNRDGGNGGGLVEMI